MNTKTASVSDKQKQQLAAQNNKSAVKSDPRAPFWNALKAISPTVGAISPKQFSADRLNRIFFTALRRTPKLMNCKVESFVGSVITSAYLGLEPGPLGHCYFVPYKDECQFQLGYLGMIELARRSGRVSRIEAHTVRQSDIDENRFTLNYGSGGTFKFDPNLTGYKKDDPIVLYVAYLQYNDGSEAFTHMTQGEINEHRNKYSPSANKPGTPWQKFPEQMAWKTVIKRLLKFQSLSPEQQWSQAYDQATITPNLDNQKLLGPGETPAFENMIDIQYEELPPIDNDIDMPGGHGAETSPFDADGNMGDRE